MESFIFQCFNCHKIIEVPISSQGQIMPCIHCHTDNQVPTYNPPKVAKVTRVLSGGGLAGGLILMLITFFLFVFNYLLGILFGFFAVLISLKMASKCVCSNCSTHLLHKRVPECPGCGAQLESHILT